MTRAAVEKTERPRRLLEARQAQLAALAEFRYQLRRYLSFSEGAVEQYQVSAQQYQLLQVVAAVPAGQPLTVSYIAERMLLRHNSAVELVDRAERSGLVRRVQDETDHRRSLVEMTEIGESRLAWLVRDHLKELETAGPELLRALEKAIEINAGTRTEAAVKNVPKRRGRV
jgi:DNA-binding MarR family transcriptional regulator